MRRNIRYYRVQLVAYDLVRISQLRLPLRIPSPSPTPLPPPFMLHKRPLKKMLLLPFRPREYTSSESIP